jgi:hypothetical protein
MVDLMREIIIRYKKVMLIGVACILMITFFIVGKVNVNAGNSYEVDYSNKRYTNYTVQTGDSLWSIAEEHIDYTYFSDIYEYMDELRDMNHLKSDDIYYGQNLLITYYVNDN